MGVKSGSMSITKKVKNHAECRVPNEYCSNMNYKSIYKANGHKKLVRTSGLMFMVNVHKMESLRFKRFAANIIENHDSQKQIKMLEEAGYTRFTVKLRKRCGEFLSSPDDPLELVDENGRHVCSSSELYGMPSLKKSEYINLTHSPTISNFYLVNHADEELNSIVILNKNAEMEYYGDNKDQSPFCKVNNKNPLKF